MNKREAFLHKANQMARDADQMAILAASEGQKELAREWRAIAEFIKQRRILVVVFTEIGK